MSPQVMPGPRRVRVEGDLFHGTVPAGAELAGLDLACWCRLPEPGEPDLCHAAILLLAANRPPRQPRNHGTGPKPYAWPVLCKLSATDVTPIGGLL